MLQTNQARTTTSPSPADVQLRDDIRSAIQSARDAARDAAQAGRARGSDVSPAIAGPMRPGGAYSMQPNFHYAIPPQVVNISVAFFVMCAVMVIGWPLARAFGKRIEQRGDTVAVSPAMADQLHRIEQAVDTMAVEIERISESQRFMARLQNAQTPEHAALPADRG